MYSNALSSSDLVQNVINQAFKAISKKEKSSSAYIAMPTCLYEEVIGTRNLSALEKLFYFRALTNYQLNRYRGVIIASRKWAESLGLVGQKKGLEAQILRIQKSLEEKGYLQVMRSKDKYHRSMCNCIIPRIPSNMLKKLQRYSTKQSYESKTKTDSESNINWILQSKLTVPIKYDYLKLLFKDTNQSHNSKLFILRSCINAYKNYKKTGTFSFCESMVSLINKSSISRTTIYSIMSGLKKSNQFLTMKRKYIYSDDPNSNRCDKSVYEFVFDLNCLPSWALVSGKSDNNREEESLKESKESIKGSNDSIQLLHINCTTNTCLNNKAYIIKNIDNINIDINFTPNLSSNTKNIPPSNKSNFKKQTNKKVVYFNPHATLKTYSPITDSEAIKINKNSGRDFSTNFINQLLLKFSNKFPSKIFPTRNHMLSYMTEAIKHELHQSHKVNNDTFTLKCNISDDNCNISVEKYLSAIESNSNTSHESEFKRKIAGVLSPQKAYLFLSKSRFTISDDKFDITLTKHLPLLQSDKDIIFREIRAIYGNVQINITNAHTSAHEHATKQKISDDHLLTPHIPGESPLCHKIRLALISDLGIPTYKAWFLGAKMLEDTNNSTLTLTMPTGFSAHWVSTQFGDLITKISHNLGLSSVDYKSTNLRHKILST